jgi:hypothetical protein
MIILQPPNIETEYLPDPSLSIDTEFVWRWRYPFEKENRKREEFAYTQYQMHGKIYPDDIKRHDFRLVTLSLKGLVARHLDREEWTRDLHTSPWQTHAHVFKMNFPEKDLPFKFDRLN